MSANTNTFRIDRFSNVLRIPSLVVWILLGLLAAGAFIHLNADFPHDSRWIDDSARFTDEGWYASGALNHILTGHWLRPGDFNPAVTIPVWPAILELLFHFTGISLALARGVAVAFGIATVLTGGALMARRHRPLASVYMLLLGTSPLLYFFSRSALVEPALIFFLVCSAWAAQNVYGRTARMSLFYGVLCGVFFVLAMLTKSSALFVAPAMAYLLWFPQRSEVRRAMRAVLVPSFVAAAGYSVYWILVIHTHPGDFRTLLGQNTPSVGWISLEKLIRVFFRSVTWIDPILFPIAVIGLMLSIKRIRTLWLDPLFGFAVLFYCGYSVFLVLHVDAGPHYFDVLVFPVSLVLMLFLDAVERELPALGRGLGALTLAAVVLNVGYIGFKMLRPQYTLRDACAQIRRQIDDDPTATRLVIGHGAIQTTYLTLIPALDDLGTTPVAEKLNVDHPGWVVTWNDNLDVMQEPGVAGKFTFVPRGEFPVFDLAGRDKLLLYRIDPK